MNTTGARGKQEPSRPRGHASSVGEPPSLVVRRLVEEVMNRADLGALESLYAPRLVGAANRWIGAFLESFTDVDMRIVELVAEGEAVAVRFACSGTHTGAWLGHPPTGRRFTDVAEVYFFRVVDGRIVKAWGLEDTHSRLRQLGLAAESSAAGTAATPEVQCWGATTSS